MVNFAIELTTPGILHINYTRNFAFRKSAIFWKAKQFKNYCNNVYSIDKVESLLLFAYNYLLSVAELFIFCYVAQFREPRGFS